ncbi:hypothetical protein XcuCFBP2542_14380 [Xanthomonas cucurbitae]|uniref:Porin n=1 Tax=Xanthomonas cucurbitae TaxID=56453 RepID=A0A2S7DNQ2_9XANT|nr:DcaP family trimeric outer membrane transporter [Xanthomonas cucurbitae]PPU75397.1 hypothetical protein XcuCFBP2542_14380 [Xanthomonas cucurbitae]WDM80026.1 porin [Xanthomonas cucurbitae]WDM83720.1 porin [Xanthomonas cucurbitae]
MRRYAWLIAFSLSTSSVAAQTSSNPEVALLRRQVEDLRQEVAQLRLLVDARQAPTHADGEASASHLVGARSADAPAPVAASVLPPRETFGDELTGVARPNTAAPPNDPALRGFVPIPGTDTRIRLGGFAKLNAMHDFDPAGNPDRWATSSLPIDAGAGRNSNLDASATRFSFEVRRPSSLGPLRFYLENDFYGGAGVIGFRLRQAHAQVGNTYAGYGYSAFTDSDAFPETLDDAGPGSESLRRVAAVRQFWKVGDAVTASLSIEDPESDLAVPAGGAAEQPLPDLVAGLRREGGWGHLQGALLARRLAYRMPQGEYAATATGFHLSGQRHFGLHVLTASLVYGEGVSRYINDIGGRRLDAVVADDGSVHPLGLSAGHLGYTYHWPGGWRSNLVFGRLLLEAHPQLPRDAFRASTYGAANLILQASPTFSWGIEALYGTQTVQDGRDADAFRIQGSIKYDFVR